MKELTLQEIQNAELEIMIRIDQICREQGIEYYLQYGTLIGAIRNKGFIPWDDDLDIMMPRAEYERFLEYFRKNAEKLKPLELMHHSVNKKYIYPIARISDSRYIVDYADAIDYGLGIFVDIYPYDGCGNTFEEAEEFVESLEDDRRLVRLAGIDHFVPSPIGKFRSLIKRLSFYLFKVVGPHYFVNRLDKKSSSKRYEDYPIVGCTVWTYTPIKKEWMQTPTEAEFEGHSFYIPNGYDEILKRVYGDYMTPPPEEKRYAHHSYTAYRKQEGNKE